ncbi:MAG: AraC family transcriptional regulator [Lachnospiraceae bacterium]|nr:AraC family transcriptional regulator [Lachnospiraceae bacterium]
MEWVERLNESINYIEEHLTGEIDYEQLGRIACCSAYHFQRMFTYMADVTLSEYIRRRKMSLAAVDLQSGDEKVIDIAEKYGYHSPTAFNRAFQSVHGVAPSAVKGEGVSVKSFPPITFTVAVKGAEEMNYRIETKEAFRIIGVSAPLERELEKNFAAVPQMWERVSTDGTIEKLAGMMDTAPMGLLGVCACNDEEQWKYYIAVSSTKESDEFEEYMVPASTWAVFSGTGTNQSIQELEQRILTEWLPTSGYEYADAPDIEVYLNPDPQNAQYEVWIPVTKKQG